jgi:hypothetical protein
MAIAQFQVDSWRPPGLAIIVVEQQKSAKHSILVEMISASTLTSDVRAPPYANPQPRILFPQCRFQIRPPVGSRYFLRYPLRRMPHQIPLAVWRRVRRVLLILIKPTIYLAR